MQCHQCKHEVDVKAGKYKDVPFEQTPCARCSLHENSIGTQAFDDERVYDAGPVCEASVPYYDEIEQEPVMPVSALSAVVALLLALPPKTRDLVCWRHQGMQYKKIAANLGATAKAVEIRHKRAFAKWPVLLALFPGKAAKQAARGRRRAVKADAHFVGKAVR